MAIRSPDCSSTPAVLGPGSDPVAPSASSRSEICGPSPRERLARSATSVPAGGPAGGRAATPRSPRRRRRPTRAASRRSAPSAPAMSIQAASPRSGTSRRDEAPQRVLDVRGAVGDLRGLGEEAELAALGLGRVALARRPRGDRRAGRHDRPAARTTPGRSRRSRPGSRAPAATATAPTSGDVARRRRAPRGPARAAGRGCGAGTPRPWRCRPARARPRRRGAAAQSRPRVRGGHGQRAPRPGRARTRRACRARGRRPTGSPSAPRGRGRSRRRRRAARGVASGSKPGPPSWTSTRIRSAATLHRELDGLVVARDGVAHAVRDELRDEQPQRAALRVAQRGGQPAVELAAREGRGLDPRQEAGARARRSCRGRPAPSASGSSASIPVSAEGRPRLAVRGHHEAQLPARPGRVLARLQQRAHAGRVHEGQAAQVDDDGCGSASSSAACRRPGGGEVQLAAHGDAQRRRPRRAPW